MKHSGHRVANHLLQTLITFIKRILYKVTILCKMLLSEKRDICLGIFMVMLCMHKMAFSRGFLYKSYPASQIC